MTLTPSKINFRGGVTEFGNFEFRCHFIPNLCNDCNHVTILLYACTQLLYAFCWIWSRNSVCTSFHCITLQLSLYFFICFIFIQKTHFLFYFSDKLTVTWVISFTEMHVLKFVPNASILILSYQSYLRNERIHQRRVALKKVLYMFIGTIQSLWA